MSVHGVHGVHGCKSSKIGETQKVLQIEASNQRSRKHLGRLSVEFETFSSSNDTRAPHVSHWRPKMERTLARYRSDLEMFTMKLRHLSEERTKL